jgi:hypothetical protein
MVGEMIQDGDFVAGEDRVRWHVRVCPMNHRQPEYPPRNDAQHGDQLRESLGSTQLGFLDTATGFEDLVKSFNLPPLRVPVDLFDGRVQAFHRQVG